VRGMASWRISNPNSYFLQRIIVDVLMKRVTGNVLFWKNDKINLQSLLLVPQVEHIELIV